jgi:hypothetical protein
MLKNFHRRATKAQFLFTSDEKLECARKLCGTDKTKKHDTQEISRFWMPSLVAQLSELCESSHSQEEGLQEYRLRPFREEKVTKRKVCEDVSRILQAPLSSSEKEEHGTGYVYVLRNQK